jgi:hypothetical protein
MRDAAWATHAIAGLRSDVELQRLDDPPIQLSGEEAALYAIGDAVRRHRRAMREAEQ